MNKSKVFGILILFITVSLVATSTALTSTAYDQMISDQQLRDSARPTHDIVSQRYLSAYTYCAQVKNGRAINFHIKKLAMSPGVYIQEGDKKLKRGDAIHIRFEADPYMNLNHPDQWALIYVNDVKALYPKDSDQIARFFHYVLPLTINISNVDIASGMDGSMFGDYPIGTTVVNFFDFVKYFNEQGNADYQGWDFSQAASGVVLYEYDQSYAINPNINISVHYDSDIAHHKLIYDKGTGMLNEYIYTEVYSLNNEVVATANLTLIRSHGWGLPYNVSTWVVWGPIIILTVLLIVAIKMQVIQRIKIYFEAKKLAKRE